MLGLSPAEARERFEQVIEFAELEEFEDLKLKNYSSRHARAARVLGDDPGRRRRAAHRRGARGRRRRLPAEVLRRRSTACATRARRSCFVTHDMGAVERFCDRAMLIERGRWSSRRRAGDVGDALPRAELPPRAGQEVQHDPSRATRYGDGTARIVDAWFEDEAGRAAARRSPRAREHLSARSSSSTRTIEDPIVAVMFENDRPPAVFAASTAVDRSATGTFRAGETAALAVAFENVLAPGRYFVTPSIVAHAARARPHRPLRAAHDLVRGHAARASRRRSSTSPTSCTSSAAADARPRRVSTVREAHPRRAAAIAACRSAARRALAGDLRRFVHLTWTLAVQRLQAALLRLGARLPLAAHAAAAAVRRALPRLHAGRPAHRRRPFFAVVLLMGIVLYTFFAEATGGAVTRRGRPREPRAQDPLPAARDPDVGRDRRVLQPRAQPRRRRDLRLRVRRDAAPVSWLGLDPARRGCSSSSSTGIAMLLSALLRALPRRRADLGRAAAGRSSTRRRSSSRSRSCRDEPALASADHRQPAGGDRPADPPLDDRPERDQRGGRDRRRVGLLVIPLAIVVGTFALGF